MNPLADILLKAKFQIEQILTVKEKVYVLVRHLNPNTDINLTDSSTLGDVPIENWVDIPRAFDNDEKPRNDYYAFALKYPHDKNNVTVEDTLDLNNHLSQV